MPSGFSRAVRLAVSWPFTMAPSTATPNTAPSSRLVFAADAAMPDRSGSTELIAALTTGTSAMPKPAPARPRRPRELGEADVGTQDAVDDEDADAAP